MAPPRTAPPLASILIPVFLGSVMLSFAVVDLAVDLSGRGRLAREWYGMQPDLPLVSHWFRFVGMFMIPMLAAKVLLISVPGAARGTPGCMWGCAPLVVLPTVFYLTFHAAVLAKNIAGKESASFDEEWAALTRLHALKCAVLPLMPASALGEYLGKSRAAARTGASSAAKVE